jgi:orotate phosphoribosyltransferase
VIIMSNKIAEVLLKAKAVTLNANNPYTYASGIRSPIYCDNRRLIAYPVERKIIIDEFLQTIETNKLNFDVIAGTATAGIPWAAWIAARLDKPMIYIRGKSKEHGKQNLIEGHLEKDQTVLIIEDLISTGDSSIAAVNAISKAGANPIACLAIFTYEMQEALDGFKEINCPLYTLTNFTTVINFANQSDYIDEEDKDKVLAWNKDPSGWFDKISIPSRIVPKQ